MGCEARYSSNTPCGKCEDRCLGKNPAIERHGSTNLRWGGPARTCNEDDRECRNCKGKHSEIKRRCSETTATMACRGLSEQSYRACDTKTDGNDLNHHAHGEGKPVQEGGNVEYRHSVVPPLGRTIQVEPLSANRVTNSATASTIGETPHWPGLWVPSWQNGCNQRLATIGEPHHPILSRVRCIALLDGIIGRRPQRAHGRDTPSAGGCSTLATSRNATSWAEMSDRG